MIKTLTNLFKQDKEKFVVPKGVQDVIPVAAIFDDGIFKVGKDKYSKTYRFTDINYAVASREDKEAMFLEYSELLNSLDSGATTKITINVEIYFTKDELESLTKKVRKSGLSRESFCRHLLNGAEIKEAPSADVPMLINEVRRVGYNIDQILRMANARGMLDVPKLREALTENRKVEKMITAAYTMPED